METYYNTIPAKMTRGNDATTVLRNSKAPIKTDGSTSKTDNRRSLKGYHLISMSALLIA